jgi:hypothetical protein
MKGQTFTSRLSCFCFVQPAQALLNSTPQLLARDRGALAAGRGAGPGDLRMDAAAQAAVGADHQRVFAHGALDQIRHVVAGWSAGRWRQEHQGRDSPGVRKISALVSYGFRLRIERVKGGC